MKAKNSQSGYSRIVIKRVYEVAEEKSNVEMTAFYEELAKVWKDSYLGLHLTGSVEDIIHLNPPSLSEIIFSEDVASISPSQEIFGEKKDGTVSATPLGLALCEV